MRLSEKKLRVRSVQELAGKFLEIGALRLEKRRLIAARRASPCLDAIGNLEPCWKREQEDTPEGHNRLNVVLCPACVANGERRGRERAIGLRIRALNVSACYCAQAMEQTK